MEHFMAMKLVMHWKIDVELQNAVTNNDPHVVRFLEVMALCNTVLPIKTESGGIIYKAQSQDEEALVDAAARLNMVLINKDGDFAEISICGSIIKYEILDILEFTSDRKRMSVVVKDCQTGNIFLLSKGADEAIIPFSHAGKQIREIINAVEQYSQLGLRTLCLGYRKLEENEYRKWSHIFKEANCSLVNREEKIGEVCERIEHDLIILGVTAIEDRLQEGVPETIEELKKGGINIWMLTGDKQNTALHIARLCNLISPEPKAKGELMFINGKTEDEVVRSLERALLTTTIIKSTSSSTSLPNKEVAFVVDGSSLEIILNKDKQSFTELALLSKTAICCRLTPSQKAQLVELLKSCEMRTLAIGDGGNDVRMIQKANVGVGISGREGLQAARASDFSIPKFKFLKRLILVHGRYSYIRTAFISQYSFYKSLLICFIQILFSFFSGLSGTSLFNSISLMAYNVLYTSVPVFMSVLDKDLSENTILHHPQILSYCQAGRLLNPITFAGWFGRSIYHALVIFVITVWAYSDGRSEMEGVSMVALSGCIWIQAFLVTLDIGNLTIAQMLAIWGNLVAFYIINFVASAIPSFGMYGIMFHLFSQASYWITMLLIVAVGMGPILAIKYYRYTYRPNAINVLQQMERSCRAQYRGGDLESHANSGDWPPRFSQPLLSDSLTRSC